MIEGACLVCGETYIIKTDNAEQYKNFYYCSEECEKKALLEDKVPTDYNPK